MQLPSIRRVRLVTVTLLSLTLLAAAACGKSEAPGSGTEPTRVSPPDDGKRLVELTVVYGSEKKAWFDDAIARFNASNDAVVQGGAARVHVTALAGGSGNYMDIVDGRVQAHVWSPASDVFRPLMNRAWTTRQGAVGGEQEIAPAGKPLVLTPVVIAMWRPMAEALGWPATPLGWKDVLALATDPAGWGSRGHAEWGLFKLGHTHPEFSNSGLLSVLAELYAASGKTTNLSNADVASDANLEFVRKIEQSIVHYGKSTGFFAERMLTRGPAAMSAAVLYENLVTDSYARAARPADLVAIYPKEGTFWCDNPFITLRAPWVTDEHRAAAAALEKFLLSPDIQRLAMTSYGFRPSDPSIAIAAPLDAAHGVDPKQPQTLLETPGPDVLDQALAAWRKAKKTVDIVFVFDRSGSMQGEPLRQAKQGARDFIGQLDERDRVAIMFFNDQVPPIPELREVGESRDELLRAVDGIFAVGGTSLRDSIQAAHAALGEQAAKDPMRVHAVVVLTDGRDTDSRRTEADLERALTPPAEANTSVRVFTIAYGPEADKATLGAIAERAQGASFVGTTENIRTVYQDLAAFF